METNQDYKIFEDTVRQSFASIVWTHKIQEKQADIYSLTSKRLNIFNMIVISLTACGIFSQIFSDLFWIKLSSSILSMISIFLALYIQTNNFSEMILAHKEAAIKFLILRNKYTTLLTKIKLQKTDEQKLLDEYESLQNVTNILYKNVPNTTDKAVEKANEALKVKEDNTYDDREIDSFLPKGLRRNN